MKKRCALLTCSHLDGFVTDEEYLQKALEDSGWTWRWVSWDQEDVNWSDFDVAIVRTTWDYIHRPHEFLQRLSEIEQSSCQLFNPYPLMQWNLDKSYLFDLAETGVEIVPTRWEDHFDKSQLERCFKHFETSCLVVKPIIGAGAHTTYRIYEKDFEVYEQAQQNLFEQRVMIQPFLESVTTEGEYSLHYFNGEFSHGICKKPKPGDFRSQEEFGSHIQKIECDPDLIKSGERLLKNLEELPLYARVDWVRSDAGEFQLIELELIEPSLYFRMDPSSARTMVQALEERFI
ncbi:MAG: hypothetical protein KDD33_03045 [Bdellovibrionales bacterium]|nr:hypothetical protein [Bdellovibrionales bacterium]